MGEREFLDFFQNQIASVENFYIKRDRGFTEDELRATIESVAGTKLDELFSYIYTTAGSDYRKYLGYAGQEIDMTTEKH